MASQSLPPITDLIVPWCAARHADGCRPRGVAAYADKLRAFAAWTGPITPGDITAEQITRYKRELAMRCQAGTVRHSLTVIRAFCAYLVDEGYLARNVALAVKHPKVEPPDPDPLTRDQIAQLFRALDAPLQSHKYTWRRTRRACYLMLYAGLRIAEVAGLEWRDLDLERGTITIRREHAKGGRPRSVPIAPELAAELKAARHKRLDGAVVDQGDRADLSGKPLTVKSLAHIFERLLPARGLTIHAHQLRKTFATELHARGESLATIQRLLGHRDPKTTMRYIGTVAAIEHAAVAKLDLRSARKEAA